MSWGKIILAGIGLCAAVYFLSRLQMKAWLHEFDSQLNQKLKSSIFTKSKKDEDKE
jgi:hypothetical protein